MDLAIRAWRVVTPGGTRPACIIVREGKISQIVDFIVTPSDSEVLDLGDRMVLPGLVDTHVHVNEPGRTDWEGFATATQAAAAGGCTTIVDMPLYCLPATTTVAALTQKRQAATGQCWVDYGFWGGLVAENSQHLEALAEAGVLGYKCSLTPPGIGGFTMVSPRQVEAAMPIVAQTGLPLLTHAELPGPLEAARRELDRDPRADWRKYRTYFESRPDEAEFEAVGLMVELSRRYDCDVHIVQLSSCETLLDVRSAREEGLPITVETCPHYLHFAADEIPDRATQYKCAPPIRNRENRERLWDALRDRTIDLIASDHSPCPPAMKHFEKGSFREAWGGVASLSLGLPVIWTEAKRRGFSIGDVVRWMAEKPAELAGLSRRKGRIEEGHDADLVVFNPEASFQVEANRLPYRHPVSPYLGETLQGVVEMTFVRGQRVYANGQFTGSPIGMECAGV